MSDLSAYHEVFRDDFSGTSLDRSNWQIVFGGVSSNGAFTWSSENVSVGGGFLTLKMTNTSTGWTAGGISQGGPGNEYGLYQVRARVDAGQGVGPAILLWPATNIWPGSEVDLLESPAADRSGEYFTQHWKGDDGSDAYLPLRFDVDASQWHTYAVDWGPDHLTYYVDGEELYSTTSHVPQEAEWLALQGFVAAPGDDWYGGGPDSSTPQTVNLQVDWVSISEPNVLAVPSNPTFGSGPDTLTLQLSEDAWDGNALFTVAVDGQQLVGAQAVLAAHASGQSETFTFAGDFGPGQHTASVAFVNDASGGSWQSDRNLYIDAVGYNGANLTSSAALYWNQSVQFTVGNGAITPQSSP